MHIQKSVLHPDIHSFWEQRFTGIPNQLSSLQITTTARLCVTFLYFISDVTEIL
jgi:hypothetical protein